MSKAKLFSPVQIGPIEFSNRIVVAPMCQYSADNGCVTDWHRMHVMQYAISGAALFMLEATSVTPDGRITPLCLGLYNDEQESKLHTLIDACKRYGSTKLGIQLNHAGRKGASAPFWLGGVPLAPEDGGWQTYAPSAIALAPQWPTPNAYSESELQALLKAYCDSTQRSARVGFDVLEIHAAHGYLLHQFLSPISNHRQDKYGGDAQGRQRFPLDVVKAVRAIWPGDRVLGVRVSTTDWLSEGLQIKDVIDFLVAAKQLGVDYVCVSSGGIRPDIRIPVGLNYQVGLASEVRRETGLFTRAVGMIVAPKQAEEIVQEGHADQIAIARGFIDDPRWVWHAADQLGAEIGYAPQYERAKPALWPGFQHRAEKQT